MTEPVTMFGEELVPERDEFYGDWSYYGPKGGPHLSIEPSLGGYEAFAKNVSGPIRETPKKAARALEDYVVDLAPRLPADVFARMVARRKEVDRG